MGLKEIIEQRKIGFLTCLVDNKRITKEGISGDVLLFVSLFPRHFLKVAESKLNVDDYKIMLISSSLLYEKDNLRTYYNMYYKNPLAVGYKTRLNESSFMKMFLPSITVKCQDGSKYEVKRAKDMSDVFPTVPNACIKWEGGIPDHYISLDISLREYIDTDKDIPLTDVYDVITFFCQDEYVDYSEDYIDEVERLEKEIDNAVELDAKYGTNEVERIQRRILYLSSGPHHDEDEYDSYDDYMEPEPIYILPYDPEELYWENDYGYLDDIHNNDGY